MLRTVSFLHGHHLGSRCWSTSIAPEHFSFSLPFPPLNSFHKRWLSLKMRVLCYSLLPVTYNYSLEKVHSSQHGLEGFILVTSGLGSLISVLQWPSSLCFSKISLSFQPHGLAVIFPLLVLAFSSFTSLGVSKISNLHICITHLLPNPDKQGPYLDYSSY